MIGTNAYMLINHLIIEEHLTNTFMSQFNVNWLMRTPVKDVMIVVYLLTQLLKDCTIHTVIKQAYANVS